MKKKILLFCISLLILIFTMIPSAFAEDVSVMAVLPTYDDQIIYTLFPAEHYSDSNKVYYNIVGLMASGAASNPNAIPFVRTYHPDIENIEGSFYYELYDGQSKLLFSFINNMYTVTVVANNLTTGDIQMYDLITGADISTDFYLYVGRDGYIYLQKYDFDTGLFLSAPKLLDVPLYGDIYLYNDTPDNSQSYNNGYINGKADGESIGFEKGYQQGMDDQNTVWNTVIESIRQEEYAAGKADGIQEGIAQSAGQSVDAEYWYNAGFTAGQDTNGIVKEGIEGFWDAMGNFINPFLNIGIGSLTVRSLLAVLLLGGLSYIIIRLVKG